MNKSNICILLFAIIFAVFAHTIEETTIISSNDIIHTDFLETKKQIEFSLDNGNQILQIQKKISTIYTNSLLISLDLSIVSRFYCDDSHFIDNFKYYSQPGLHFGVSLNQAIINLPVLESIKTTLATAIGKDTWTKEFVSQIKPIV